MSSSKRRVPIYVGIGAVVVVVAIVLVAVVPSLTHPGSSTPKAPMTFSAARAMANASVSGYQGQSWSLFYAYGFGALQPIVLNELAVPSPELGLQCRPSASSAPNVTVPALPGFSSSGALPLWYFAYMNSSRVVVVGVVEGQVSIWSSLSGPSCASSLSKLSPVPTAVPNTPAIVNALAPYDSPFLAHFTNVTQAYTLYPTGSSIVSAGPAAWFVSYSDCSTNRTEFTASVNVTAGEPVGAVTQVGSCGVGAAGYDLLDSLGLGTEYQTGSTSSVTDYAVNVTSVSNNLTWSNLSAVLETATGQPPTALNWMPVTSGWTMTGLNETHVTVATYNPSTWSWSGTPTQEVEVGDSLEFQIATSLLSSSLSPPLFFLGGHGQFGGTLQLLF